MNVHRHCDATIGNTPAVEATELVAAGDKVVMSVKAPEVGLPIDGAENEFRGEACIVFTLRDGMIVRIDDYLHRADDVFPYIFGLPTLIGIAGGIFGALISVLSYVEEDDTPLVIDDNDGAVVVIKTPARDRSSSTPVGRPSAARGHGISWCRDDSPTSHVRQCRLSERSQHLPTRRRESLLRMT